ncbi:MAG: glycosyltransferase family 4 protein [Verrucomicrobiota bacterium]
MNSHPLFDAGTALVIATLASWGFGYLLYPILIAWRIVDHPNERSSHQEPTARGGGIAIVLVILSAGLIVSLGKYPRSITVIGACVLVLSVVSFIDDRKPLPALSRFGFHVCASFVAVTVCFWPELARAVVPAESGALAALVWTLALLWLTGYTNAFNFMDGINGLAAGQAALTALGMGFLCLLSASQWSSPSLLFCFAVAGAAAGFLPHNFPRARMFMGDVGSAPLGFLLASLGLLLAMEYGWHLLIPFMLLQANFLLDTGITLVRRVARGEKWAQAHREHFYQRLVRAGYSHYFVTGIEMVLQAGVIVLMWLYIHVGVGIQLGLIGAVVAVWLSFFTYAEVQFRRCQALLPDAQPGRHSGGSHL